MTPFSPRMAIGLVRCPRGLRHAARHEAADAQSLIAAHRPDHGSADTIRFGDDGVVGYVMPFAVDPDAIMPVAGFPI
jgi:hypothetical protein